jgi:hypothetical protein
MHGSRRDLGKRLEHETPSVHPRVRDHQPASTDPSLPIEQHVNIDAPGTVAEGGILPHPRLDALKPQEQVPRAQARPQFQDPV